MKRIACVVAGTVLLGCSPKETPEESSYSVYILEDMAEAVVTYLPAEDSLTGGVATGSTPNHMFSDGNRLYVVNSGFTGSPSVGVYELTVPPQLVSEIPMPPGSNPYAGAALDGKLYVSGLLSDKLYILDGDSLADSVAVGKAPEGVLGFNGKIYVVCTGYDFGSYTYDTGSLYRYDPGTGALDSVRLGVNPQWCAADDQGLLHVLLTGDYASVPGKAILVDPGNLQKVDSVSFPGHSPGALAILGDWAYAVGWDGVLLSYDVSTMTLMDSLLLGDGIMGLAAEPQGLWATRYSNADENWLLHMEGFSVSDSVELGPATGAKALLIQGQGGPAVCVNAAGRRPGAF